MLLSVVLFVAVVSQVSAYENLTCDKNESMLHSISGNSTLWWFELSHFTRKVVFHTCGSYVNQSTNTLLQVYYYNNSDEWEYVTGNDNTPDKCPFGVSDWASSYVKMTNLVAGTYLLSVIAYGGDGSPYYLEAECTNETSVPTTTVSTAVGDLTCDKDESIVHYMSSNGTLWSFDVSIFTPSVVFHTCYSYVYQATDTVLEVYYYNSSDEWQLMASNDDQYNFFTGISNCPLGYFDVAASYVEMEGVVAGSYMVHVYDFYGEGGSYYLEAVCNGSNTTTTTIDFDNSGNGEMLNCGDTIVSEFDNEVQYWKVRVIGARATVQFDTCGSYVDYGFQSSLYLYWYNESSAMWMYEGFSNATAGCAEGNADWYSSMITVSDAQGLYYMRVDEHYHETEGTEYYGNFTLSVTCSSVTGSTTSTTANPTTSPTDVTFAPSVHPSREPTAEPTTDPTVEPTADPTSDPVTIDNNNMAVTVLPFAGLRIGLIVLMMIVIVTVIA